MTPLTFESPAKLNLFLAVTGRRADGFHDSGFGGGSAQVGRHAWSEAAEEFSLICNDPAVPIDATNLVLKAATVFRRTTGYPHGAKFTSEKRIPIGRWVWAAEAATPRPRFVPSTNLPETALSLERLGALAAEVGSDCPLFLNDGP